MFGLHLASYCISYIAWCAILPIMGPHVPDTGVVIFALWPAVATGPFIVVILLLLCQKDRL